MSKITRDCLTKTECNLLHFIRKNTLNKNTVVKRDLRSFRMKISDIAISINCSERTVQRALKHFTELNLIERNKTPKKFWKGPHFIALTNSFHESTKDFFKSEKNVTPFVTPIINNINKTVSISLTSKSNKKTITNINKSKVSFISEEILNIDLKNLDSKIGLTHSDLQNLKNKINWSISDIQNSIINYSEALELGLFSPMKLSAKDCFLSIMTGSKSNNRPPKLFNKITPNKADIINNYLNSTYQENLNLKHMQNTIENEIIISETNIHWNNLSELEKLNYIRKNNGNIESAMSDFRNFFQSSSLSTILKNCFSDSAITFSKNSKISKNKFKLEIN